MRRLLSLLLVVAGCGDNKLAYEDAEIARHCLPTSGQHVVLRQVAKVDGIAVLATSPPNDDRLFVVVREGTIRIIDRETLRPEPFLDVSPLLYLVGTVELGLLGMAFHPQYASNGQFFIFYTTEDYSTVARCQVDPADPNRALPACTVILEALHNSAHNHNGGMLEFGPDGYLYIGTGDGGGAGDPNRRSQDPNDLLGKILRIDVDRKDAGKEYAIPPGNPYVSGGGRPEVFMRGLRNPWRFSFDSATGDLWIGDVGQNHAEEMDVLRPSEQAGANLGWSVYEGNACCSTQDDLCLQTPGTGAPCDATGMTFPKDVRDRFTTRGAGWYSIIGGQVYRGDCYPDIVGYAFYTDIVSQVLVKARLLPDGTLETSDTTDPIWDQVSSIHAGPGGELYVTKTNGSIYHLEAGP